jgi:hypothetical protein
LLNVHSFWKCAWNVLLHWNYFHNRVLRPDSGRKKYNASVYFWMDEWWSLSNAN